MSVRKAGQKASDEGFVIDAPAYDRYRNFDLIDTGCNSITSEKLDGRGSAIRMKLVHYLSIIYGVLRTVSAVPFLGCHGR